MINRLDSVCQVVLKGKWPGSRRVYEGSAAVSSFYTTKLLDHASTLADDPAASPQGSKVKKHDADREKEFSVKINDVCVFVFFVSLLPPACSCLAELGLLLLSFVLFVSVFFVCFRLRSAVHYCRLSVPMALLAWLSSANETEIGLYRCALTSITLLCCCCCCCC